MQPKKPYDVLLFSRQYKRIIIYGAGLYGRIVCCYLKENNIDIEKFVVTGHIYNKTLNHEVININEANLHNDTGVIVCGNDAIIPDMVSVLEGLNFTHYICVNKTIVKKMDAVNTYAPVYHEKGKKHILLYHRVADVVPDVWNIAVKPSDFKRHLEFLKSNYNVVSYEDMINAADEVIAITFDDGYVDFYTNAFPIIQELQVPVTIFVSTGKIGKTESFWWDEIEDMVWNNKNCPSEVVIEGDLITLHTKSQKLIGIEHIRHLFMKYNFSDLDMKLEILAKKLNTTRRSNPNYRCMTEEELIEIDRSPLVTVGGHTVTHTRLTSEDAETQLWEMRESKHTLEHILGHEVTTFSFPFGCETDYDDISIHAALKAGYTRIAAVKTKYYDVEKYKYNPSRITVGVEKKHLSKNSDNRDIRRNIYLGTWLI